MSAPTGSAQYSTGPTTPAGTVAGDHCPTCGTEIAGPVRDNTGTPISGTRYEQWHAHPELVGQPRSCRYQWGDWACDKATHGPDEKHSLVWANTEDDVDPRLT